MAYADDICISTPHTENITKITGTMEEWCKRAGMKINKQKSAIMEITYRRKKSIADDNINGYPVKS